MLTRDAAPDQLDEIADFEEGQAIREPVRSIAEHFRRAEDYRRLATFKRDVNST